MKRIVYLLFILFASFPIGIKAQNPIQRFELHNKTIIPYDPEAGILKDFPTNLDSLRKANAKKVAPKKRPPLPIPKGSVKEDSKRYIVKGVIAVESSHKVLSQVEVYGIAQPFVVKDKNRVKLRPPFLSHTPAKSNKKGKFSFQDVMFFWSSPDSINSYVFMHPDMEPYGISIHIARVGNTIDLDTLFMTPIKK